MNVSALIDALEAEGMSAEAIVRALKAADKRRDNTGAERQARYRDRRRNGVTVTRYPAPNERDNLTPALSPVVSSETTAPALKPEHVVEVWNENAPVWGLKPIRKLTPARRRKLSTRIRENTIDEFTEAIAAIGRSSFLRGENGRGWRADFDWMLEPRNFTKLTEGTYDR